MDKQPDTDSVNSSTIPSGARSALDNLRYQINRLRAEANDLEALLRVLELNEDRLTDGPARGLHTLLWRAFQ